MFKIMNSRIHPSLSEFQTISRGYAHLSFEEHISAGLKELAATECLL